MNGSKHCFLDSMLLDNYGMVHLVNNLNLLKPGSIKDILVDSFIEAGMTRFYISAIRRCVICGAITENGVKGDLTLNNAVYMEGFHVNIVLEARLLITRI